MANRRVLVTRSAEQAGELAEALRAVGLEPALLPVLAFEDLPYEDLDAAAGALGEFDWLVLTSVNAVKSLAARMSALGATPPAGLRVAAVGAATAGEAERKLLGRPVDLVSPEANAESLAAALGQMLKANAPGRFLVVRALEGREVIERCLRALGAEVTVVAAYRTVAPEESVGLVRRMAGANDWPAAATFTSPSTARNLLALLERAGASLPAEMVRVAIGPVTAEAMEEMGMPAQTTAAGASSAALAEAVVRALAERKR